MSKIEAVKKAMLAVQRYPWEQGVCMQALYESGDISTAVAMAHDAVLRQQSDGRLAVTGSNIAVTDPAANGEVVYRAYEITKNPFYKEAAEKMLRYLLYKAPRTSKNILCHNEISFQEGFSPDQIWVDSIYMAPPFLAVMGHLEEAVLQINGMMEYLQDEKTGLLFHIFDAGQNRFVRQKLWATGNGWALLGLIRVMEAAKKNGAEEILEGLKRKATKLLDAVLKYQLEDGRFHDIFNEEDSFIEGAAAMMIAAFIYRGVADSFISKNYLIHADKVSKTMDQFIDEYGIIHEVCGCPDFVKPGTSAESMASYIMMYSWKEKVIR